eukprot:TRINITY_DN632_c0_g1_i1.p1 TRINITY_DN632_c0_g1~~TRINITY_DN632_c0_g1_i1.p1  ORF type:complete len:266 (+),score=64.28 TRINITY_DN632_c0_g1_i1:57-800(+)
MAEYPKCVVLFAESLFSSAFSILHPNLDRFTCNGCAGRLLLRQFENKNKRLGEFIQLLDVDEKGSFTLKYNDLKASLFTPSKDFHDYASFIGVSSTLTPTNLPSQIIPQIKHVIPSTELTFVHIQEQSDHAVKILEEFVHSFDEDNIFLVVVGGYGERDNVETPLPPASPFLPQQSYCIKDGQPVTNIKFTSPLHAVYHCKNLTRKDDTTTFTEENLLTQGGNGIILAEHFLKEIAFKLGHMPKYGA